MGSISWVFLTFLKLILPPLPSQGEIGMGCSRQRAGLIIIHVNKKRIYLWEHLIILTFQVLVHPQLMCMEHIKYYYLHNVSPRLW